MPRRIPRKLKKEKKKIYVKLHNEIASHLYCQDNDIDPYVNGIPRLFPEKMAWKAYRADYFIWHGPTGSVPIYIGSPRWCPDSPRFNRR